MPAIVHRMALPALQISADLEPVWNLDRFAGHSVTIAGTSLLYTTYVRIIATMLLAWDFRGALAHGLHSSLRLRVNLSRCEYDAVLVIRLPN